LINFERTKLIQNPDGRLVHKLDEPI